MTTWIKCTEELPPSDGAYCVSSSYKDLGVAWYDGYGFKDNLHYVSPTYWKYLPVAPKPRYGKVTG